MKRILIVADYPFYRFQETWYAEIPWDEDFNALFQSQEGPRLNLKFLLVGRTRDLSETKSTLHRVDLRYFEVVDMPDWRSWIGWLLRVPLILPRLISAIRESEVLFLKLFYLNSVLAFLISYVVRRPIVTLLVGDSAEALTWRQDLLRWGRLRESSAVLVRKAIVLIQRSVERPGFVAQYLRSKYGSERESAFVANESWLRDWMYHPPKEDPGASLRILFVGRLIPLKGVDALIDAVALARNQGREVRLVVVGDGPQKGRLLEQTINRGLLEEVEFRGWVPGLSQELFEIYRQSKILCLPSAAEGMPLVLLEAMANGVAVVASAVGGIRELVSHEETGLLLSSTEPEEICAAVCRLMDEPGLWRKCTQKAFEVARTHSFSVERGKLAGEILSQIEEMKSR